MSFFGSRLGALVASALAMSPGVVDGPSSSRKTYKERDLVPKDIQAEKKRLAEEKRARKAAKRVRDGVKQV